MNKELKDHLKALGVRFDNGRMINLKHFDHGSESEIYTIEHTDNILKISKNKSEYEAYMYLISRLDETILKVFEVPYLVSKYRNKYYFVFRRLSNLPREFHKIMSSVEYILSEINVENMRSLESKKEAVVQYLDKIGYSGYEKFLQFLISSNKILVSHNLRDVHSNNIMIDNQNNFKIIDVQLEN